MQSRGTAAARCARPYWRSLRPWKRLRKSAKIIDVMESLRAGWEAKKKMAKSISNPQIDEIYELAYHVVFT